MPRIYVIRPMFPAAPDGFIADMNIHGAGMMRPGSSPRRERLTAAISFTLVMLLLVVLVGMSSAAARAGGGGGGSGGGGGKKTTTTTTTVPAVPKSWAPASTATITPGVTIVDAYGECTANFVFSDGAHVYIGTAAHCGLRYWPVNANGCDARNSPFNTTTQIRGRDGSLTTGSIVYNSWKTMQATAETSPATCAYNDFQLIQLTAADAAKVNPSVPVWGGPVATAKAAPAGSFVYTFGRSDRPGKIQQGRRGISEGTSPDGWTTESIGLTASTFGDSGSPFLDSAGNALGVLSTGRLLALTGTPLTNGVIGLENALSYMASKTSLRVQLAPGTEAFHPIAEV